MISLHDYHNISYIVSTIILSYVLVSLICLVSTFVSSYFSHNGIIQLFLLALYPCYALMRAISHRLLVVNMARSFPDANIVLVVDLSTPLLTSWLNDILWCASCSNGSFRVFFGSAWRGLE
jgi:hypothetical protein